MREFKLLLKCICPDMKPVCSLSTGEIQSRGHPQRGTGVQEETWRVVGPGLSHVDLREVSLLRSIGLSPAQTHGVTAVPKSSVAPYGPWATIQSFFFFLPSNLYTVFSGLYDPTDLSSLISCPGPV